MVLLLHREAEPTPDRFSDQHAMAINNKKRHVEENTRKKKNKRTQDTFSGVMRVWRALGRRSAMMTSRRSAPISLPSNDASTTYLPAAVGATFDTYTFCSFVNGNVDDDAAFGAVSCTFNFDWPKIIIKKNKEIHFAIVRRVFSSYHLKSNCPMHLANWHE